MERKRAIPKRSARKAARAKDYILAHPEASNAEVQEYARCSRGTATNARSALIKAGLLSPAFMDHRSKAAIMAKAGGEDAGIDDLQHALDSVEGQSKILTAEERQVRLSEIARKAKVDGNHSVHMAALAALDRMQKASAARDDLGPGAPLTRDDYVTRAAMIIDVCGPKITLDAVIKGLSPAGRHELLAGLQELERNESLQASGTPKSTPARPS